LGDKAFDEASSRGLALTLGDGVAYAENQVREALAAQPILRSLRKDCALCDYITFA
jgi:hypothetical protein